MAEIQWFVVPPYNNEGWRIVNRQGELVAVFENELECIAACNAYNSEVAKASKN